LAVVPSSSSVFSFIFSNARRVTRSGLAPRRTPIWNKKKTQQQYDADRPQGMNKKIEGQIAAVQKLPDRNPARVTQDSQGGGIEQYLQQQTGQTPR
jgi:hypothetical protein